MTTYLYRAVSLEERGYEWDPEELEMWVGATLGRSSGYLSRSAARDAGTRSGLEFVIVRSEPVHFPTPPEIEQAELRREVETLRARVAELTAVTA